jgi:hypothetical protein
LGDERVRGGQRSLRRDQGGFIKSIASILLLADIGQIPGVFVGRIAPLTGLGNGKSPSPRRRAREPGDRGRKTLNSAGLRTPTQYLSCRCLPHNLLNALKSPLHLGNAGSDMNSGSLAT